MLGKSQPLMRNMRSHNAPMFVIIPEIYNCYKLVILPNHLIIRFRCQNPML